MVVLMYTYTPPRRGHAHIVVPLLLLAAALILALSAAWGLKPKLPLRLLAVLLLTVSVWLINRFALTDMIYTLSDSEASPPDCLIITRKRGKAITHEYIPTARMTAVLPPTAPLPAEIRSRYNFCNSMIGAQKYALLFDDPVTDKPSAAFLECSPDFAACIEERIRPITPSL